MFFKSTVLLECFMPNSWISAFLQLVNKRMADSMAGLGTMIARKPTTSGEAPVTLKALYGNITVGAVQAFEIEPDPEYTNITLRVVTQLDLQPWMYRTQDGDGTWTGVVPEMLRLIEQSPKLPSFIKCGHANKPSLHMHILTMVPANTHPGTRSHAEHVCCAAPQV